MSNTFQIHRILLLFSCYLFKTFSQRGRSKLIGTVPARHDHIFFMELVFQFVQIGKITVLFYKNWDTGRPWHIVITMQINNINS